VYHLVSAHGFSEVGRFEVSCEIGSRLCRAHVGGAAWAAMGLFLARDDASYVNGQAIPVDGGLTASMPHAGKPI